MANCRSCCTTSDSAAACVNPMQILLAYPMGMTDTVNDGSYINFQSTNNPLERQALALQSQSLQPLPDINKYVPDGNPPISFPNEPDPICNDDQVSPITADPQPSPSPSPHHSPEPDDYDREEKLSKSSSPETRKKSTTRKPGRKSSQPSDDQREKYLEKNRVAANKHRKKKKEFIESLESRYNKQVSRRDHLKAEVSSLRVETLDLQENLFTHARCNNKPIEDYIQNRLGCMYESQSAGSEKGLVGSYIY